MQSLEIFARKPCEACDGTGRVYGVACLKCLGAGYVHCFLTLRELAEYLEAEANPSAV